MGDFMDYNVMYEGRRCNGGGAGELAPDGTWKPLAYYFGVPTTSKVKRVLVNKPATIIFWTDGTKTVSKWDGVGEFDEFTGYAVAYAKKFNKSDFFNSFKKLREVAE